MSTRVFMSFSHKDEGLRDELETQLAMLKRNGIIETWHDRRILAGDDFKGEIDAELDKADIILLLVSPDFLASDYCYDIEFGRALEHHKTGKARVIPVILRPCPWTDSPMSDLLAAPTDGKPVMAWSSRDDAFLDVYNQIKAAAQKKQGTKRPSVKTAQTQPGMAEIADQPRSGNLSIKKTFTDADRDTFEDEAFDFIKRYIENSLSELETRNPELSSRFKSVTENLFQASIYKNGKSASAISVFRSDGFFGKGINWVQGLTDRTNSSNGGVTVKTDKEKLFLAAEFLAFEYDEFTDRKLTYEGAAEYFWSQLIERLK